MPPLLSEEEMDAMDYGDDSYDETMSTEMLEDICDVSKSHTSVNRRGTRYQKHDNINQRQSEQKGALKDAQNRSKVLHKVFKTVVKDISKDVPPLGETGSEVLHFISEPRNFSEVKKLSDDIKKPWLKATLKDIKNII